MKEHDDLLDKEIKLAMLSMIEAMDSKINGLEMAVAELESTKVET